MHFTTREIQGTVGVAYYFCIEPVEEVVNDFKNVSLVLFRNPASYKFSSATYEAVQLFTHSFRYLCSKFLFMQPNTFEQSEDTIIFRQSNNALRYIGFFFVAMGVVLLLPLYRYLNQPAAYLFPGFELLVGSILIYAGANYTYTINRTIKTLTRHTKNWLRDITETWRFYDVKDIIVKPVYISPKYGTGFYEYRVFLVLETGKKMKVYTNRQIEESNKMLQLLKQFIF